MSVCLERPADDVCVLWQYIMALIYVGTTVNLVRVVIVDVCGVIVVVCGVIVAVCGFIVVYGVIVVVCVCVASDDILLGHPSE